jgi:Tfp pilus assembly protein PilX
VSRRREERGSALVIVIMAVSVTLLLGMALLQAVTSEGGAARQQRHREAAFNLAETALNSEIFVLGNAWPSAPVSAYPASCIPAATIVFGCPDSALMGRSLSQADPNGTPDWSVAVRDDGASATWSESLLTTQPSWDADGDGRIWVRAKATAEGRPVTLVGLIAQSAVSAGFPQSVITAGHFGTGSQGNKRYVDTQGSAAAPSPLIVRCSQPAPSACLDYAASKGQVSPDTAQTGYTGGPAASPRVIADFIARAQAAGTYYDTCPGSLTGTVVVIASGDCSYQANNVWNDPTAPGVLVLLRGSITMRGNQRFYGVIHAVNQDGRSDDLVTISGNVLLQGSVLVDGDGGVLLDGSGQVVYDPNAVNGAQSYLTPQLVKSTWRQL